MAKVKIESFSVKIPIKKLEVLVEKVKDLTGLNPTVMFKIGTDGDMLVYSLNGDKAKRNVHSFKNHIMKFGDYFTSGDKIPDNLRFCISDAKRFVVSMNMFIKYMTKQNINDDLSFKFNYNEDGLTERLQIQNKKSKEEVPGGDPINFKLDITVGVIRDMMDTTNSEFNFPLSSDDFDYIKSKTAIEKDNDVLYLNVKEGEVSIGESKWEHNVGNVAEVEDTTISFPKKYFKCINFNGSPSVDVHVFDRFILVVGNGTNLMISIELTA